MARKHRIPFHATNVRWRHPDTTSWHAQQDTLDPTALQSINPAFSSRRCRSLDDDSLQSAPTRSFPGSRPNRISAGEPLKIRSIRRLAAPFTTTSPFSTTMRNQEAVPARTLIILYRRRKNLAFCHLRSPWTPGRTGPAPDSRRTPNRDSERDQQRDPHHSPDAREPPSPRK